MTTEAIIDGQHSRTEARGLTVCIIDRRTRPPLVISRLVKPFLNLALAVAVFLAMIMSVSVAVPALLGLRDMIVTSGSMAPAVNVGDLAMIKRVSPESIQVGDVVTFTAFGATGTTTHRVIASKEIEGHTYFQTKGDANITPDPNLVPAEAVHGKVVWTEPKVGYLLVFGNTMWGKILMVFIPLCLALGLEAWEWLQPKRPRQPKNDVRMRGNHRGAPMSS